MQMLVLCLGLLGCASGHVNVSRDQRAIYGADSRREHSDMSSFWQNIGDATVNIGNENDWTLDSQGRVTISSTRLTLADSKGCPSQRFANQVLGGGCSGTLIAPNKIATAAHCVDASSNTACSNMVILFRATSDNLQRNRRFPASLVYRCRRVVFREYRQDGFGLPRDGGDPPIYSTPRLPGQGYRDHAVIQLDRNVETSVTPVKVHTQEEGVAVGTELMMIGHPSRLPRKYSNGATVVVNNNAGTGGYMYFTDLDSFAGNSGSGVFNNFGQMIGILVAGRQDYRNSNGCPISYAQRQPGESVVGVGIISSYAAETVSNDRGASLINSMSNVGTEWTFQFRAFNGIARSSGSYVVTTCPVDGVSSGCNSQTNVDTHLGYGVTRSGVVGPAVTFDDGSVRIGTRPSGATIEACQIPSLGRRGERLTIHLEENEHLMFWARAHTGSGSICMTVIAPEEESESKNNAGTTAAVVVVVILVVLGIIVYVAYSRSSREAVTYSPKQTTIEVEHVATHRAEASPYSEHVVQQESPC